MIKKYGKSEKIGVYGVFRGLGGRSRVFDDFGMKKGGFLKDFH